MKISVLINQDLDTRNIAISPIVTGVKNKQVGFGISITENKYCATRAVIAWMIYFTQEHTIIL